MEAFRQLTSRVIPLPRANVDTDQIIPKQFLKTVSRQGLGQGLFYAWRQEPGFVLNDARYRGARILAAGENFGCGSSREHAVWALLDYGIRCVIAPSFGDIFYNNCCQNGVLPVRLAQPPFEAEQIHVDLEAQTAAGMPFAIEAFLKQRLLEGLDDIALTLLHQDAITAYEEDHS